MGISGADFDLCRQGRLTLLFLPRGYIVVTDGQVAMAKRDFRVQSALEMLGDRSGRLLVRQKAWIKP